jgi:hypothetical protein
VGQQRQAEEGGMMARVEQLPYDTRRWRNSNQICETERCGIHVESSSRLGSQQKGRDHNRMAAVHDGQNEFYPEPGAERVGKQSSHYVEQSEAVSVK